MVFKTGTGKELFLVPIPGFGRFWPVLGVLSNQIGAWFPVEPASPIRFLKPWLQLTTGEERFQP